MGGWSFLGGVVGVGGWTQWRLAGMTFELSVLHGAGEWGSGGAGQWTLGRSSNTGNTTGKKTVFGAH